MSHSDTHDNPVPQQRDTTHTKEGLPMDGPSLELPFIYDPDSLLVVHDLPQEHWERAQIPPVNAWAERLNAAASGLEETYAERGQRCYNFGVGDTNIGMEHDTVLSGLDLLAHETKSHGGTFGLTIVDSQALASHITSFPTDGSIDEMRRWYEARPLRLIQMMTDTVPVIPGPYGKMTGWGPALAAHKSLFQILTGVEARDHFTMTSGDRNAFFNATQAIRPHMVKTNRRKFLLIKPTWGTYEVVLMEYYGADCIVGLECKDGIFDSEDVDRILTQHPDIGCAIWCNPNNPSGDVIGSVRNMKMAQILFKHNVPAISDELYMLFVYEGAHRSMARAASELWRQDRFNEVGRWMANNIIVLGIGVQKAMGSGFRCNAAWIPNTNLRSRMVAAIGASTGQPSILSQAMMTSAIRNRAYVKCYKEMAKRRQLMLEMFEKIKQGIAGTPFTLEHSSGKGGIYFGVYLKGLVGMTYQSSIGTNGRLTINTSEDMAEWLVDQSGIVVGPASTTLISDPTFVRFSYGNIPTEDILAAGDQVVKALQALAKANPHVRLASTVG